MKSIEFKPVALAVSLSMFFSAPAFAQQSGGAGAGAAQGAAVGGITTGAVAAAVAVVAAAAALSSGSSGAQAPADDPGGSLVDGVGAAADTAKEGIDAGAEALAAFANKFPAGSAAQTALDDAIEAFRRASNAQADAAAAAANLELALAKIATAATSVTDLCGAPTCGKDQVVNFAFIAAEKAKVASDALYYAIGVAKDFRALAAASGITGLDDLLATFDEKIALADVAAAEAQRLAGVAIDDYEDLAVSLTGTTGTIISAPSGTTGSIGPSGTSI
jgi:hypothetical protein